MEINISGGKIHQYDVSFIFVDKNVKKSDWKLLLETIQRLKEKYSETFIHTVVFHELTKCLCV